MELIEKRIPNIIIESLQDRKGYFVVEYIRGNDDIKILEFDNKEEINKNFGFVKGRVTPRNVNKKDETTCDCVINDQEITLDFNSIFLVVNGRRRSK